MEVLLEKKFKINLNQDVSSDLIPPLMNEDIIYIRLNNINRITTGISNITAHV